MADLELFIEAERRGILPGDKAELLAEARRRGLVPSDLKSTSAPTPPAPSSGAEFNPDMYPLDKGAAPLLPAVGATLGGLAGAGIASVPLAAAGGAIGEFGKQLLEDEPVSPTGIVKEGAIQGVLQGFGLAAAKSAGFILAPLANKLVPEVEGLVRYFRKFGGEFTPGMRTESYLVDSAEKIAEGSLFGGNQILHHKIGLRKASDAAVDDIVNRIGTKLTPEETGGLLNDAISGKFELFKEASSKMYSNVDAIVGKARVDLTPLKAFAKDRQFIVESRKGIGSTAAGDSLLDKVGKLDDTVTFEQAQSLRSAFYDELGSAQVTKDKAAGLAKKFLSLTDHGMERAATNMGPDALDAWRSANKFYREGKGLLRSKFITKMIAKDPELAVKAIFQPGKVSQISNVKKVVGENSEAWKNLKGSYLESIIRDATGVESGELVGKRLLSSLKKMGDPALNKIFTPKELSDIRSVAGIKSVLQRDTGGGGKMLVQIAQGGAVVSLATGAFPKSGTAILLGPYAMGRLLMSKTGGKWLTEGLKVPAGAAHAVAVSERLIMEAIRETGGKDISFPVGGLNGS